MGRGAQVLCCLALFLPLTFSTQLSGLGSEDEHRLVATLFDGYNALIRPVNNMSELLSVQFQMVMHQLIDVDEKNQIVKSNVWLRMVWHDYQLKWDPADYGGITVFRIHSDSGWKPDIVLFNNADGKYEVSFKPNLIIHDNGKVLWIPPAIYKSSCTINVEYFPFDEQKCDMNFGSWTFNSLQVVLVWYEGQEKVDVDDYSPSGSWDLIACPGRLSSMDKDGQNNISMITYTITIRRKTLYYTVNLILPCVLITFLSFCVFFLPSDAHEKMTMCISILLALVVFLVLVSKILPPTSVTIPLIAKYLLFTFIMNLVTIIITVVIINWNFRTPRSHKMPPWVKKWLLNYLPRMVRMKRPQHDQRCGKKAFSVRHHENTKPLVSHDSIVGYLFKAGEEENGHQNAFWNNTYSTSSNLLADSGNSTRPINKPLKKASKSSPKRCHQESSVLLTKDVVKAVHAVKFVAAHLKNEDDFSEILDDWRYVASVIDRLLLYLFGAVTIGGTIGILINSPHIFENVDQEKVIESIKKSRSGVGLPLQT